MLARLDDEDPEFKDKYLKHHLLICSTNRKYIVEGSTLADYQHDVGVLKEKSVPMPVEQTNFLFEQTKKELTLQKSKTFFEQNSTV